MAVSIWSRSDCARWSVAWMETLAKTGIRSAARTPMTAITMSSSTRVKPARAGALHALPRAPLDTTPDRAEQCDKLKLELQRRIENLVFMGARLFFPQLVFHPFAQPLFDHALIIQIAGAG